MWADPTTLRTPVGAAEKPHAPLMGGVDGGVVAAVGDDNGVLLQSGIVDLSSTRPNLSTPVPTSRQNLSKPVTTGRRNLPIPVPTGKAVPASRPNYPIPVTSGRTNNTVKKLPFSKDKVITAVKDASAVPGQPHKLTEDLGLLISGCSRSMTGTGTVGDFKNSKEPEANVEAERLGLEFAQAEEDLIFSAAKSFQTPSTNAVTPGSTPVTPGTPLTPGSGMFTSSSYDDHEPRADLTNMSSTENVNPTSSKRVKSAHPSSLIIGDISLPV
ncbi:hypothetical protein Tco_0211981 [Tanacetum coccineum]